MVSGIQSANLKMLRAAEQLGTLEAAIRAYVQTGEHRLVPSSNGKQALHISADPPPEISLLVGEIVHQLRSALDHLAYDLVKLNPTRAMLPADWEERCLFPLWLKTPKKAPVYNCFERILPGITKVAFAFIESVQPYNRSGTANVLRLLAELSNVDKHRHLNITIPRVAVHRHYALADGSMFDSTRGGFKHGAVIEAESTDSDDVANVRVSTSAYVTFAEPTVGDGAATLEVEHVLRVILEEVKTVVIPTFDRLVENP